MFDEDSDGSRVGGDDGTMIGDDEVMVVEMRGGRSRESDNVSVLFGRGVSYYNRLCVMTEIRARQEAKTKLRRGMIRDRCKMHEAKR